MVATASPLPRSGFYFLPFAGNGAQNTPNLPQYQVGQAFHLTLLDSSQAGKPDHDRSDLWLKQSRSAEMKAVINHRTPNRCIGITLLIGVVKAADLQRPLQGIFRICSAGRPVMVTGSAGLTCTKLSESRASRPSISKQVHKADAGHAA